MPRAEYRTDGVGPRSAWPLGLAPAGKEPLIGASLAQRCEIAALRRARVARRIAARGADRERGTLHREAIAWGLKLEPSRSRTGVAAMDVEPGIIAITGRA